MYAPSNMLKIQMTIVSTTVQLILRRLLPILFCSAAVANASNEIETDINQMLLRHDVRVAVDHPQSIDKQSLRELVELTEIPAPPFGEARRGLRFAEMLRQAGLEDVRIDKVGNVVGLRPGRGDGRVVALSAHLDTVFPLDTDLKIKYQGDKMYAPGIGDNTRGLVSLLSVLHALQAAKIQTEADLLFIGNVGEEGLGDLRGIKYLFRDGAEPIDALIAIDGGSSHRIVYGGVGSHRYRIVIKGPGGHSWGAFGMANPHHAMGRGIARFVKKAPVITSTGEKTSFNIGRIGGGTSVNSIPFESWAEVDLRSGNQEKLDEIDALLRASFTQAIVEENAARTTGQLLQIDFVKVGKRPAAAGNADIPLVKRAVAASQHFGFDPSLEISSTDANLPISLGIPAITVSRGGRSGNAHSPNEWWQNDKSYLAVQIMLLTLLLESGITDVLAAEPLAEQQ
jgi:acetylornithine deacetylase/succinyl-diaminopimelate desuccinylase-like protein|tara:strand:- start:20306 stop:21667 length:1362 start_codon:yes stop_codon:yes gene_type:complete